MVWLLQQGPPKERRRMDADEGTRRCCAVQKAVVAVADLFWSRGRFEKRLERFLMGRRLRGCFQSVPVLAGNVGKHKEACLKASSEPGVDILILREVEKGRDSL